MTSASGDWQLSRVWCWPKPRGPQIETSTRPSFSSWRSDYPGKSDLQSGFKTSTLRQQHLHLHLLLHLLLPISESRHQGSWQVPPRKVRPRTLEPSNPRPSNPQPSTSTPRRRRSFAFPPPSSSILLLLLLLRLLLSPSSAQHCPLDCLSASQRRSIHHEVCKWALVWSPKEDDVSDAGLPRWCLRHTPKTRSPHLTLFCAHETHKGCVVLSRSLRVDVSRLDRRKRPQHQHHLETSTPPPPALCTLRSALQQHASYPRPADNTAP